MKYLITLLLISISFLGFSQRDSSASYDGNGAKVLNKHPIFKSTQSISAFISKNLSDKVKGYIEDKKVKTSFRIVIAVDTLGNVSEAYVLPKGVDPILEAEFIRIAKLMKWEPALDLNNKPEKTMLMLPINL